MEVDIDVRRGGMAHGNCAEKDCGKEGWEQYSTFVTIGNVVIIIPLCREHYQKLKKLVEKT